MKLGEDENITERDEMGTAEMIEMKLERGRMLTGRGMRW